MNKGRELGSHFCSHTGYFSACESVWPGFICRSALFSMMCVNMRANVWRSVLNISMLCQLLLTAILTHFLCQSGSFAVATVICWHCFVLICKCKIFESICRRRHRTSTARQQVSGWMDFLPPFVQYRISATHANDLLGASMCKCNHLVCSC